MTHPLDGARAKIKRAGQHLRRLDAETDAFAKTHRGHFTANPQRQSDGWDLWIVRYIADQPKVEPPLRIGAIAGDVAHNLRSALDHLVCQLSQGTCTDTQFPICDTEELWRAELKKKRLDGVGDRHRAMIERVQPYHGRQIGRSLRALREMSNADKHRLLTPVTAVSPLRAPRFGTPGVVDVEVGPLGWRPVKDGAEIMRFRTRLRYYVPNMDVDFSQSFTIVFGEAYPVTQFNMRTVRNEVRRLIGRFAREF